MSQVNYFLVCLGDEYRAFIQDVPQCKYTNSYSEPVNAIRQPSAGKSITACTCTCFKESQEATHTTICGINPSTREPCSQYMTTASSSPGSAAPDCYGTHYTQLLSAAGHAARYCWEPVHISKETSQADHQQQGSSTLLHS